ncbi:uncharacterized protein SPPG_05902 [Spizellomyces punctatus DAOM BR117]|uniref:Gfo/Idh/MocA-like oxidoreductase N-terminal domain-containing protein n=1 Tax=Spizellomyces punctatus (strain DAOM BR117) TaxID=645134 RepID=A0A0L0HBH0_SPIPD|nr:uncharacterized protein SPPG_05902 [Spizellomyces punctatus DAOM BR117]KNC98940.1 hypothetical protein SPPG_05902 [Spizellomyces punctatus DAOM BR117]|eukprot:XP_016606980.1 hypothetical protein SPPG_05902 [Spizellomyces punctatus DAOM BR117]
MTPLLQAGTGEAANQVTDRLPVKIAVIGAGERGKVYASFALHNPLLCQVVALAEPVSRRREAFLRRHVDIPAQNVFLDWKEMVKVPKLADAVVICTLDQLHAECVVEFAKLGYHILCEKPMAISPQECAAMTRAVVQANIIFAVCHVLRYSPYNRSLKQLLEAKACGDVINIVHVEPVGWWHFAHSYVRGNWRCEEQATFSLMAKSCHDLDILCHYMGTNHPPRQVHSFGSLSHFRRDKKPAAAGLATRCVDCAFEKDCPYSALKLYLDKSKHDDRGWPASVVCGGGEVEVDMENVHEALKIGPYGRCVYESDNDVCDHQVVNIEFEGGATASFTMVAFSELVCERQTRIHGSRGAIIGDSQTIRYTDFATGKTTVIDPGTETQGINGGGSGHGGGDYGLMATFIEAVAQGNASLLGCSPQQALMSHVLVFAAEEARKKRVVIDVEDYLRSEACID